MIRRYGFIGLIILVIAAVFFILHNFNAPPQPFRRCTFQAAQKKGILINDKQQYTWIDPHSGSRFPTDIREGTGISFDQHGELSVRPGITGPRRIAFSIYIHCEDPTQLTVSTQNRRTQKTISHQHYELEAGKKFSTTIIFTHTFHPEDILRITMTGRGALITGSAIIYDTVSAPQKQYIILIALDTLRQDRVGRSVNGIQLTPNINQFAQDAIVFENAFSQGCWTLPAFTSLFTGLYEFNHKISKNTKLDWRLPFLVEELAEKFVTISLNGGAWLGAKFGNARGFDIFELSSQTKDIFASRTMFEYARETLQRCDFPKLFCFLHTYAIHPPFEPPERFLKQLVSNPKYTQMNTYNGREKFRNDVDTETRQNMTLLYDAEILAFDHYFGRFIDYLKTAGIYDNAMIIFMSDHGEEFYEHHGWGHGHSLYNEVIRIPLIWKFPRNRFNGQNIKSTSGIIDILPTILDFYKCRQPHPVNGISLMPAINGKGNPRDMLFSSLGSCVMLKPVPAKIAVFFGHHKILYNFALNPQSTAFFKPYGLPLQKAGYQIFDLSADPDETHDIARQDTHLLSLLQRHIQQIVKRIKKNFDSSTESNIHLTTDEINKLKTLGYL